MRMKLAVQNIFRGILTIGIAGVIAGCDGQNPANRESNPLKKYNGLNFDIPPGQVKPEENDGQQSMCGVPFTLSITDSTGANAGRSLHFLVNDSKTYDVRIASSYSFAVTLAGAPSGVQLEKKSDGDYSLTWKPTSAQGNLVQDIKFVLTAPSDKCVDGVVYEDVTLNVNVSSLQPTISVTGFDDTRVYGPTDKIAFQVTVMDPTLGAGEKPQPLQIDSFDKNPTGETALLNSESAVNCDSGHPTGAAQTFIYSCTLDIAKMIAANPNHSVGLSALEIYTKSAAGESSVHIVKEIKVSLPGAKPQASTNKIQTGANV